MAVGFLRRRREPLPPVLDEMGDVASLFRVRSAQCLLNANYTKPTKYVIEALVIYAFVEFIRSKDVPISSSLIIELTIVMAIRAGYHRDPSHFPNLSLFEKEMRRRLWSNLYISDLSMSFDIGKPRSINDANCDVEEPRNLAEEDFDEATQEYPPERSDDEPSNISFNRCKFRMTKAFAHIYDANNRITPISYDEVLRLDRELREAYEQLPPHMQLESREFRNVELSQALIWQYNVGMQYQKARCVLHRPYTFGLDSSERQNFSRDNCQDAALEILKYQRALQGHLEPGGALHKQWFFTAQETQDSILAAMLICRDLSMGKPGSPTAVNIHEAKERRRRDEQIAALEDTCLIWQDLRDTSGNAYKAYLVVREVLRRVKPQQQSPKEPSPTSAGAMASSYSTINPEGAAAAAAAAAKQQASQMNVSPLYDQVMSGTSMPPMQSQAPQQWGTYSQPAYTTGAPVSQMPVSSMPYAYQINGNMDGNGWVS